MLKRVFAGVSLVAVFLLSTGAWADQISFGATPTMAQSGTPTLFGAELLSIGNGTDFYMYLKGNAVSTSPVLLIIGVPNDPAHPNEGQQLNAGSITGYKLWNSTLTASIAGNPVGFSGSTGYSSITSHNSLGFAGDFNSGDLYNDFFGISSVTASQQFQSNWQNADQTLFPGTFPPPNQPVNFGIYVFALTFPANDYFSSKSSGCASTPPTPVCDPFIEVTLGGGLPIGSYALGYSIDSSSHNNADNFTPFTTTGVAVPEPASLIMLGTGLLVAGGSIRRRLGK